MRPPVRLLCFSLILLFIFVATAARFEGSLEPGSYVVYAAKTPSHAWEGRAPVESLRLSFDAEAPNSGLDLEIVLDADSFTSGNFARDINARRTVFDTDLYPQIIFTGKRLSANTILSKDGEYTLELSGALSMHGVTRDLTTSLTLTKIGDTVSATGSFEVLLSDFEMKPPSIFGSTVEDRVTISYFIETVLAPSEP